jgi:hypothetical protein
MHKIRKSTCLFALLALSWPSIAGAQSQLPPCSSNTTTSTWTDCRRTETDAKGNLYVGEFKDGMRHGQGAGTFVDGTTYTGEFKFDAITGKGVQTFPNGDKYIGEFKDGLRHGNGTFVFANGGKFVGQYQRQQHHKRKNFQYTCRVAGARILTGDLCRKGVDRECRTSRRSVLAPTARPLAPPQYQQL